MPSNLMASVSSPSGGFSAKVHRRPSLGDFRSVFYVEGVRQNYADAFTESWAEALRETTHSLSIADEIDSEIGAAVKRH